jgi:hypothetical protein
LPQNPAKLGFVAGFAPLHNQPNGFIFHNRDEMEGISTVATWCGIGEAPENKEDDNYKSNFWLARNAAGVRVGAIHAPIPRPSGALGSNVSSGGGLLTLVLALLALCGLLAIAAGGQAPQLLAPIYRFLGLLIS